MVLHRKSGEIELFKKDSQGQTIDGQYLDFRNVLDYFGEGDTFVLNDTKVFPARLYGTKEKTDAKIEVVPQAVRFFYPKGLSYRAKNSQSGHKFAEITP